MNNLTAADIDADILMISNSLKAGIRYVPSSSELMIKSATIPFISLILSLMSTIIFYVSSDKEDASIQGFWDFFVTEGWYLIIITMAVGAFFFLIAYNNILTYMTIPKEVRTKSLILRHLSGLAFNCLKVFVFLLVCSAFLSGFSPWFAIAIPALMLVLLFVVSGVIGAEINRLGAGFALEKISKLISKI